MSNLQKMKERKDRGASFIMQDDIARFLGGDYNHPLFDPTIDFIILLKNTFLSQSQSMNMSVEMAMENAGIPKAYDPEYFEDISLGAGFEATRRTPELPTKLRKQMSEYFEEMEGQRSRFATVDKMADDVERNIFKKSKIAQKKPEKEQQVNKTLLRAVIDVIMKRNVQQMQQQLQQQARKQPQTMLGKVREVALRLTQQLKPSKLLNPKLGAFRKIGALVGSGKQLDENDRNNDGRPDHDEKHQQVQQVQQVKQITENVEKKQDVKQQPIEKTTKEFISSAQIDKIARRGEKIKAAQAAQAVQEKRDKPPETDKKTEVAEKIEEKPNFVPPEQKVKMEEQKKSQVRIAEMKMEDAVKLLQNSGIKTTEASASPAVDKNLKDLQQQQQNKPEKQRL